MIEYTVKVWDDRTKWFLNGKYHREDGPAITWDDGTKYWYLNGKLHREDGPAVEYADGTTHWYKNDKLHREDGPALEYADGQKEWWIEDEEFSETEFLQRSKPCSGKKVTVDGIDYTLV